MPNVGNSLQLKSTAVALTMAAAIPLSCSRTASPEQSAVAEAKLYSSHPERIDPQQRLGTDWIQTRQGRVDRSVMVDPGDPNEVQPYYEEIEKELGTTFPTFNAIPAFFGYRGLTGKELENLASDVLMDPSKLAAAVTNADFQAAIKAVPLIADDVLAARFFAPKITDVATKPEDINLGWRKVVRLKAREKSPAKDQGLTTAWLLFNVFSNKSNPFEEKSLNNQVMLIRGEPTGQVKPVYWLVFSSVDTANGDGDRINSLNASFDNRAGGNREYYLPKACAHCHGGLKPNGQPDYTKAKLNYLDTDHWQDRTKDDFTNLLAGRGVLFDGGVVEDSETFRAAFGVFYKLNTEVKAQNKSVDAREEAFQTRAVNKWLALHQRNTSFVDMFDRNIAPSGGAQWTRVNPIDRQVLPLLNRYCFRCHSSIEYHVFDKDAVLEITDFMVARLKLAATEKRAMPQDRDLTLNDATRKDRDCLIQLLPHVGENTALSCPP